MPDTRSRANADAPPDWDIFDGYFDMASGEAEIDVDMVEETPLMRADAFGAMAAVSDGGGGGEGMDVNMHTNAAVQGARALPSVVDSALLNVRVAQILRIGSR